MTYELERLDEMSGLCFRVVGFPPPDLVQRRGVDAIEPEAERLMRLFEHAEEMETVIEKALRYVDLHVTAYHHGPYEAADKLRDMLAKVRTPEPDPPDDYEAVVQQAAGYRYVVEALRGGIRDIRQAIDRGDISHASRLCTFYRLRCNDALAQGGRIPTRRPA